MLNNIFLGLLNHYNIHIFLDLLNHYNITISEKMFYI